MIGEICVTGISVIFTKFRSRNSYFKRFIYSKPFFGLDFGRKIVITSKKNRFLFLHVIKRMNGWKFDMNSFPRNRNGNMRKFDLKIFQKQTNSILRSLSEIFPGLFLEPIQKTKCKWIWMVYMCFVSYTCMLHPP